MNRKIRFLNLKSLKKKEENMKMPCFLDYGEVKGLKLNSSFYFADFDQLKSSFKQQIFAKI